MQWNSKAGEFRALRLRIIFSSGLSDYFYILRVASPTLNICNIETLIAHLHTLRSVRSPIANTYLGIGKGAKNNSLVGNSTPDVEYASLHIPPGWALFLGSCTDMIYTYPRRGMCPAIDLHFLIIDWFLTVYSRQYFPIYFGGFCNWECGLVKLPIFFTTRFEFNVEHLIQGYTGDSLIFYC